MAKKISEFYEEIRQSDDLQKELQELLTKKDKQAFGVWAKSHDCSVTSDEAKAFLEEKAKEMQDSGELTPDEMEQVSGGTLPTPTVAMMSVLFAGVGFMSYDFFCRSSSSSC